MFKIFCGVSQKMAYFRCRRRRLTVKMSDAKFSTDYNAFNKLLNEAKNIIVITGAGISAESGIPTFTGGGGFWRTHRMEQVANEQAFRCNPSLVWDFYHYRREMVFRSQPNNAHKALAEYEQLCESQHRKFDIITQNVDGLHQKAGSVNVIEMHGSICRVKCTKCKVIYTNTNSPICEALRSREFYDGVNSQPPVNEKDLPRCINCRGLLRPNIVWFGEMIDGNILENAKRLAYDCDICLLIGTSSNVYPTAMLAPTVAELNKPVAEFNTLPYPAREDFKFYFQGPSAATLPKALGLQM